MNIKQCVLVVLHVHVCIGTYNEASFIMFMYTDYYAAVVNITTSNIESDMFELTYKRTNKISSVRQGPCFLVNFIFST